MSNYTPGPWQSDSKKLVIRRGQGSKMGFAREAREDCYLVETANGGHRHIAFVRNRIDAQAIAFVPEMVDLLYKAHEKLADLNNNYELGDDNPVDLCFEIRKILRRIEGEEEAK